MEEADVGDHDGLVWRLRRIEQGSLPGLAVGDSVVIDVVGGDYAFTKPGVGRVATLPAASSRLEKCTCCTGLFDGSLRFNTATADLPWVTLSNSAERVKVTFIPARSEALLDPVVAKLVEERSTVPSGT
jgi:hypothetical protein